MKSTAEQADLLDLIVWIDKHVSGLSLPADERSMLAGACFDVALEHQAAIAMLYEGQLYGSMLALLRVLTESLVNGLWLRHCATMAELGKFKKGSLRKEFREFVEEFETHIETPNGVLSGFKLTAWKPMNGFIHTGFIQVSRRHAPGLICPNYDDDELCKALGVAGALGLIAAQQVIDMSDRRDLIPASFEKMTNYAETGARRRQS
jgi:hypothetical protein